MNYEKEHLQLVRDTAAEGTLFLKTNGDFPLKEAGKIAAYGDGVRRTVKGGTGSGEVNSRFSVNIEEGLKEAGFEITTNAWLDGFDSAYAEAKKQFKKDVKAYAKEVHQPVLMVCMGMTMLEPEYDLPIEGEGDVAIYVVGRNSGEGNDRKNEKGDVKLTDSEVRDILALDEKYEKFMLVLNVGGVVDLTPVKDVSNILILSQLGVVTGNVLADILLGKANPSGKLATTWTSWEDYCAEGDFGDWTDTNYKEGIYVGYRYFDTVGKKALFPFGFGLSYTSFDVENENITIDGTKVTVSAKVTNTGDIAGKEVVQIYVSTPEGKLDQPYQQLAAFAKSGVIESGASEVVSTSFDMADIASYDEESASYILESGNYVVRVGNSSVNTSVAGVVALDETATVLQAKNVLGNPGFEDYKPENKVTYDIPSTAKILPLSKDAFATKTVAYDTEYPVDDVIKSLTDEELAYVSIGNFNPKGGIASVIGDASSTVAGAAGESVKLLKDKGIMNIVMADGPAGLRLAREYYTNPDGSASAANGTAMIESMEEFLGPVVKFVMNHMGKKQPKDVEIKEQYATAIPIGTAIAQSFNFDLAKQYGDIVGDEMERFGVHLWLAPALNIHRSIRCGRNFEYYSEDPVVSGMIAAAITLGVQNHPGCGTTIKHYAANNAETNRYANNSHVSERAMREIYLRGFKICVEMSQPKAVMTSYNLLNGTHTSEHRGLTEDVLRSEFGFKGIVMTDWVIAMMVGKNSKYPCAKSNLVAAAGGDLFMPGSKGDYDNVLKALKSKELSREQLEINATRVYRMGRELHKLV